MTREQILEERCGRFRKLLLKNIPYDALINTIYDWKLSGEITYNDARYLAGLVELNDKSASYTEKPPLGVMPKDMWDYKRKTKLIEAMCRYLNAEKDIPKEWVDEYNELCKEDLSTT